jgi:hypothetical protein
VLNSRPSSSSPFWGGAVFLHTLREYLVLPVTSFALRVFATQPRCHACKHTDAYICSCARWKSGRSSNRKLKYPELSHISARVRFEIYIHTVSWSSAQNDHRNLNKTEITGKQQHRSRTQRPIVKLGSTYSSLWRHQGQGLSTEDDSDDLNSSLPTDYCISLLPPPNEWQRQVTFGSDHLALFTISISPPVTLHIPSPVTFTAP